MAEAVGFEPSETHERPETPDYFALGGAELKPGESVCCTGVHIRSDGSQYASFLIENVRCGAQRRELLEVSAAVELQYSPSYSSVRAAQRLGQAGMYWMRRNVNAAPRPGRSQAEILEAIEAASRKPRTRKLDPAAEARRFDDPELALEASRLAIKGISLYEERAKLERATAMLADEQEAFATT